MEQVFSPYIRSEQIWLTSHGVGRTICEVSTEQGGAAAHHEATAGTTTPMAIHGQKKI